MTVPQIYIVLIPTEFCTAYFTAVLTGATIFPVCPTCKSLGTKPASTAAREAPTEKKNSCHFLKLYYSICWGHSLITVFKKLFKRKTFFFTLSNPLQQMLLCLPPSSYHWGLKVVLQALTATLKKVSLLSP